MSVIRIAINGFGRIGRNVLRAIYESDYRDRVQVVAINDLGDAKTCAHLLRYDSVHGRFAAQVALAGQTLSINGDAIDMLAIAQPEQLPWKTLNIDVVLECTGRFTSRTQAEAHLRAGARKVIISAPADEVDATVVFGVNDQLLTADMQIISNASCTTNCLAPVAKVLNDAIGIEQGMMTTVHSYTNDQQLLDLNHKDIYRARSATQSMIPTKTGAAKAVGLVLPELKGKLDGMAVRVPTINVSLVDLHFLAKRETSADEVNQTIKKACTGKLGGVLKYNEEPLVSVDFNHDSASSTFDANQTKVSGRWVKVMAWYDNEWGFSHRMVDNAIALMQANKVKRGQSEALPA
ncbi:type I glyceraldehyde-3-phosphate dehydrogenase [Permianibacter aggregans]|uniref:Glyceraldehyde-3-phosphate dehydrogenase n=1 Tax=Permianibacter aggregans TaxID=1510150 RepID=A0A4R6UKS6_9GAMM|nr:type I glyceraldehyde-3-phosphate dehydrogenase [Permianibacter aggregans]QGX40227.1 type I glyceraldehyde-3-phosphate dehydrogenase [Permianibacter aggregans]TDQ47481.1 glyceraldehyde 3-phosphate dehydrogenase [Permianibacter aggregans]